jgi:transposase
VAERDTLHRPNRRVILFLGPTPKGSGARSALEGRTGGFVLEPNLDGYRVCCAAVSPRARRNFFKSRGGFVVSRVKTRPIIAAQAAREQGIGGDGNGRGRAAMGERAWPAPARPRDHRLQPHHFRIHQIARIAIRVTPIERTLLFRHDKSADKNRNVIEHCFGRLKGFRRIATRYDKLAGIFFSALCLVAIVAYWL